MVTGQEDCSAYFTRRCKLPAWSPLDLLSCSAYTVFSVTVVCSRLRDSRVRSFEKART